MKKLIIYITISIMTISLNAQSPKTIELNPPDLSSGLNIMQAFSLRASATDYDTTSLNLQDLSDLLWAANGINRPEERKRTAPSSRNAQDIDLYVFFESGVYFYDFENHALNLVSEDDHRSLIAGSQAYTLKAPVILLLVSDISRFPSGDEARNLQSAAYDAGIVSQNISLFCAGRGMRTRIRASMDKQKLREILKLKDSQHMMLNNPVSY